MKKLFVLVFAMLIFTGCKDEWKVKTATVIAETGAPVVAKAFTCSNQDEIKNYLFTKLRESKLLKKKEVIAEVKSMRKGLGSVVCLAAVEAILPPLVDFGANKLPENWGCTGEALENTGKLIANEICAKIPL